MNPTITQEIAVLRDFLDQQNDLGILIGSHQNLDTIASALAFYLSLNQAGKKVQIVSKKAPTVEVSNLVGVDRITENFVGNTNKLVVSLPYIKGEVEKVLFTEAPNTINFHLTAAPDRSITPFSPADVKLNWEGGAPSAIITFGVGTTDELNGVVDINSTKIVNIDNYPGNTRFGDVVLVDESFSSLSEAVGKIIKDLQLPIDIDIAQNMLDGVLFATRNFTKQNTSPLAFEAASNAMYHGAQRKVEEQQQRREFGGNPQRQSQDRNRNEQPRSQNRGRVNDNDFPAMHMQGQRPQQPQNINQESRRMSNNPPRNPQLQNQPRMSQQQFGQQSRPQRDLRNEPMPQRGFEPTDVIEDAQIIPEPLQNQPIEDVQMPTEQSFNAPTNEEIPDDWLMPKVFKSSKNNN